MASGSKSNSVFTGNPTGEGKSNGMVTTSIGNGQKLLSAYPQDNVHGVDLPDTRGCALRGGVTNLGHSLKGASAVQDGPGAAGSVNHVRIRGGH